VNTSDEQRADHQKVRQRLDADRPWIVVLEEGGAGELRLTVDHHSTAPADSHPARPAIRERPVYVVLDVVQRIQHHHVRAAWNLVALEARFLFVIWQIAEYLQRNRAVLFRLACGHRHAPWEAHG